MISDVLKEVMAGGQNRTIGLTEHPYLPMYITNLGDRPGLLIEVELPQGSSIEDGQGFDIINVNSGRRSRVLIRPTRAGIASPAFLGLVEFVFRETARVGSRIAAVTALLKAVHEFRKFFAARTDRLSESAVRGFFAELELLLELISLGMDPQDILQSWSGPFRGTDIQFADGSAIEVKSTRASARTVKVSSEHQLVIPNGGLHLFVRPLTTLSPRDSAGTSLLDLIAKAQSALTISPTTKEQWDTAIEAIGFNLADPYYRKWRFVSTGWQAYSVLESFPRIIPSNLDTGISSVSYSIDLDSVEAFREDHRIALKKVATAYE